MDKKDILKQFQVEGDVRAIRQRTHQPYVSRSDGGW